MQMPQGAGRLPAAAAAAAALRGAASQRNGAAHRCAEPELVERSARRPGPECEAREAPPPRGAGFLRRWRAILAGWVTHAVERAKARRRAALDRRLLASFDDDKLRDIGLDRSTAEVDGGTERP
jgi:hypothetical protein